MPWSGGSSLKWLLPLSVSNRLTKWSMPSNESVFVSATLLFVGTLARGPYTREPER